MKAKHWAGCSLLTCVSALAESERAGSPLEGLRVVVTRAKPQAAGLVAEIERLGGVAITLPLLKIVDAEDDGVALAESLGRLGEDDWLVVLSPNGARRVVAATDQPRGSRLAAIASGTAAVFENGEWTVDLVPDVASSVGLLAAFSEVQIDGRVLIAQAEVGRTELADGLGARGVDVEVVAAYRNVMPPIDGDVAMAAADSDTIVFASPSAVERYTTHVGLIPTNAVCIGSVTAATATEAGFEVTTAAAPTVEAIVEVLVELAG